MILFRTRLSRPPGAESASGSDGSGGTGLDARGVGSEAICACLRLGAGVVAGVVRNVRVVEVDIVVLAEVGGSLSKVR